MKRILTILCTMITAIGSASAQNPMLEDMSRWADGWKHAFSKEGGQRMETGIYLEIL